MIGIGIIADTAIYPKVYINHLVTIALWAQKHQIKVFHTERVKVAQARNQITCKAIKDGCDYLMMLDTDHILPPDALDLLMENKDAAIVSGLICRRHFPYSPVMFKLSPSNALQEAFVNPDGKVHEVDACAMGCTLINMDILCTLPRPIWVDDYYRSDLMLCEKVRHFTKAKILLDTRVIIGHLGDVPVIMPNNADEFRLKWIKENETKDSI